jgi:hypothetical protein
VATGEVARSIATGFAYDPRLGAHPDPLAGWDHPSFSGDPPSEAGAGMPFRRICIGSHQMRIGITVGDGILRGPGNRRASDPSHGMRLARPRMLRGVACGIRFDRDLTTDRGWHLRGPKISTPGRDPQHFPGTGRRRRRPCSQSSHVVTEIVPRHVLAIQASEWARAGVGWRRSYVPIVDTGLGWRMRLWRGGPLICGTHIHSSPFLGSDSGLDGGMGQFHED